VHAPGSTKAIVSLELFNVMDAFFRRTNSWLMEASFDLVDQREYVIPTPPGACVVRAMGVQHNGVPVPSSQSSSTQNAMGTVDAEMTFPDGDAQYHPDLSNLNPTTSVFSWAIYRPDFITVSGNIDEEIRKFPLTALFALSLDRSCLECECGDWDIPEWMWGSYFEAWYNGTLSALYGMPSKPWSNAQLAVVHGKKARNKSAFHKQEARRGFNYAVPTWRFPRGGWT
jgi:hypothetical protein